MAATRQLKLLPISARFPAAHYRQPEIIRRSAGAGVPLLRPDGAQGLGLVENELNRLFLLQGGVFVLAQDALHHQPQFGADTADNSPFSPLPRPFAGLQ